MLLKALPNSNANAKPTPPNLFGARCFRLESGAAKKADAKFYPTVVNRQSRATRAAESKEQQQGNATCNTDVYSWRFLRYKT